MPLNLNGILEGLSNAADAPTAAQRFKDKGDRKQQLSDDYRKSKLDQLNNATHNIQKMIALMVHPDTMQPIAGKEQAVAGLRAQLNQIEGYQKALSNPDFDPMKDKMHEDPIRRLGDKLHLTKPVAQPSVAAGKEAVANNQTEPNLLTPDEQRKAARVSAGIDPRAVEPREAATKYYPQLTETTDAQNKKHYYRVPMDEKMPPEEVKFREGETVTPKGNQRPKSQYDQQKEEYARSLGKTPQDLTWKEEEEFIKKRNPFGSARLGIAYEMLTIAKANEQLKQNQSDFTAYLQLQKQLTPLQRLQTASSNADDYVKNPSGPGDVALVFAFIEATKPTSGFRFTDTERKWIVGTRGAVDGALTRINQGFTGETLSPEQRTQIAAIIKHAGGQVQQETNRLLQGAASFKPNAAKAAQNQVGRDDIDEIVKALKGSK